MFLTFLLIVSIVGRVLPFHYQEYDDHWGYSLGDDWDVSNDIAATNPYYNTWQHSSAQLDQHAFAQHMGKIYRGQLAYPESILPGQRAFGHDSDFNIGDFAYESGAFEYKFKGQNVVATQAHVDSGLAIKVGEHVIVPPGVQVLSDGSITIQSSHPWAGHQQHNPCNPNPCSKYKNLLECVAVNTHTAKCSPPILESPQECSLQKVDFVKYGEDGDYQLVLSWNGAADKVAFYDILVVPVAKTGVPPCKQDYFVNVLVYDYIDDCGIEVGSYDYISADDYDYGYTTESISNTFTTATVSADYTTTSYLDYIYQIFLYNYADNDFPDNSYNFESPSLNADEATPVLTVKYKGVTVQTIPVPQGTNTYDLNAYFFGCFVPQPDSCGGGYINTGQSGYYATSLVATQNTGLCSATQKLL